MYDMNGLTKKQNKTTNLLVVKNLKNLPCSYETFEDTDQIMHPHFCMNWKVIIFIYFFLSLKWVWAGL